MFKQQITTSYFHSTNCRPVIWMHLNIIFLWLNISRLKFYYITIPTNCYMFKIVFTAIILMWIQTVDFIPIPLQQVIPEPSRFSVARTSQKLLFPKTNTMNNNTKYIHTHVQNTVLAIPGVIIYLNQFKMKLWKGGRNVTHLFVES